MNKKLLVIIAIILATIVFLCGCQEQKALTSGEKTGQIRIKSDVVELHRSSFNITTKPVYDRFTDETYEIVESVVVKYLFKNIADRPIHIKVSAEFYDKNDRLVGIGESGFINLPKDYAEKVYTPQNSITYSGSNVADVKYVLLIVEEVT